MSNVAKSPSLTRHIFVGLDDSELYLKFITFPTVQSIISTILLFADDTENNIINELYISWREQINFQWNDDEVRFVLDQHA
jgi:hypothetical protein